MAIPSAVGPAPAIIKGPALNLGACGECVGPSHSSWLQYTFIYTTTWLNSKSFLDIYFNTVLRNKHGVVH